ncbi:MAG: hypothetical protein HQK65_12330 [Desulfamplus sp.]|nr:hypothetical protein [Desulfamplus sp.]
MPGICNPPNNKPGDDKNIKCTKSTCPDSPKEYYAKNAKSDELKGVVGKNITNDTEHKVYKHFDKEKIKTNSEDACAHISKTCKVVADKDGNIPAEIAAEIAAESGMPIDDFEAIRRTCLFQGVTITMRDTNPACIKHILAGVESKGHDVLEKTLEDCVLEGEEAKELSGLVSTFMEKPPCPEEKGGKFLTNPEAKLRKPKLTGDYDIMDMLDKNGQRIKGQSKEDVDFRDAINDSLPLRPSQNPPPSETRVKRVMHGAQAEYLNFLKNDIAPGDEKVATSLFKPEAPLTVFDHNGDVYRLETINDVFNFYICRNTPMPNNWNREGLEFLPDSVKKTPDYN